MVERVLNLHGWVALAVLFAVPALESSAFLGFIFPGEVAVLLGGVLAFEHRVSLPAAIAVTIAGAIIGDAVGYEVGKHHGRRIIDSTIGRIVKPEHLGRAEKYLAERGGKAVFLGRFTAALRVLIPGLSGMSGMRYRTFAVWNMIGGAIWATGFVLLGYAAGTSYHDVEDVAKRASLLLLGLVVVVGGTFLLARHIARNPERLRAFARRILNRPVPSAVRTRFRRQIRFLVRRLQPGNALGLSLTFSLALIALTGIAFGSVLKDVVGGQSLDRVDRPVLDFFVRHREPWLTTAAKVVTMLGSSALLLPVLALAAIGFWYRRRRWRPAAILAGGYAGAVLLYRIIKPLVARPRPPLAMAVGHFSDFSFPSAHATQALVAWGLLAALIASATTRWSTKVAAWATALLVALLVGVTRLYLGAHWLTDVVGGWILAGLWLSAYLTLMRSIPGLRDPLSRTPKPPSVDNYSQLRE